MTFEAPRATNQGSLNRAEGLQVFLEPPFRSPLGGGGAWSRLLRVSTGQVQKFLGCWRKPELNSPGDEERSPSGMEPGTSRCESDRATLLNSLK